MNTSISTTDLSVRAKNALHCAGIHTVEQLKVTPVEQLRKIRNMGKKSLTDIEDFLCNAEPGPLMASQATLRDYFAAKAMEAVEGGKYDSWEEMARCCYAYADAMLKARNNEQ